MLFTLVLFSLLLVSVIGITALIAYKIFRMGRDMETVTSDGISVGAFRKKLVHLFEHTCRKSNHSVLPKVKRTFTSVKRRVLDKHVAFTDRMNGNKQKGRSLIFLKKHHRT